MATGISTVAGVSTPAPAGDSAGPRKATRLLLHACWIIALCLGTAARIGRFGFHPSDQGFILAQSWRLLQGDIPHSDIISARPLGSAVLHLIDFALPFPLFVTSDVVSMLEIVLATVALAALVSRRPLLSWGPGFTALVAAAALLNLNSFPLMAWHTIDGIALTACGFLALDSGLRSDRPWRRRSGLFLLGCAVLVKQSFAPAAIVGVVWLLAHPSTRAALRHGTHRIRRLLADVGFLAAFPLGYVGVVALDGGFIAMLRQLTGGEPAYGIELLTLWLVEPAAMLAAPVRYLTAFVVAAAVVAVVRHLRPTLARHADLALLLGTAAIICWVVVASGFVGTTRWADVLWWIAAGAAVVHAARTRRVPWHAAPVLGLGFMISLSWGQDTPTLLAGSLALTALSLLAHGHQTGAGAAGARLRVYAAAMGGLLALGCTGWYVVDRHDRAPYLDLPQGQLTEDLGEVSPAMRGVRTNPSTFRYIAQIEHCVRAHPATNVAVLPDNAFVYPALELHNPLPMDWTLPPELVADARARMLDAARALDRRGDYLVLFQTVQPPTLAAGGFVPTRVAPDAPIVDYVGLTDDIKQTLGGQTISCGSFAGVWSPTR